MLLGTPIKEKRNDIEYNGIRLHSFNNQTKPHVFNIVAHVFHGDESFFNNFTSAISLVARFICLLLAITTL